MYYRLLLTVVLSATLLLPTVAQCAPDVSGKIVLANLDRYDALLRLGKTRREIKPKKASVLSPKKYPVTIEYWSGNTKAGWRKHTINEAGIYGFNFKRGLWTVTALKRGKTVAKPAAPAAIAKSRAARVSSVRAPMRRGSINADRNRWHPLARAAWFAGSIYQFARDEQDRDIVRRLLVDGRRQDWKEFEDWLRDTDKIGDGPKAELYGAMDELGKLSDADWKEIETADEADWDQAKADLGDLVSEEDWKDITEDYAEIDTADFWKEEDVDVDFEEVDFEADLDIGEDFDLAEDFGLDDLDIDADSYDLGDFDDFDGYDGDWGGDLGDDFGGDDFIGDDDFGDFGGDDFGDDFDF